MKKYQIIYADPPWKYDFSQSGSREIENKYPTMTVEEICELEVPSEEDAVLYLWATAPKLLEALEVMKAWGFEYKTNAVWDKLTIGMGYWFRGQHELLLVGTRGRFSPPDLRVSSVFREKKTEHSKKPPQVRQYLRNAFSDKSKVELFARKEEMLFEMEDWKGWDVWGNEVKSDVKL